MSKVKIQKTEKDKSKYKNAKRMLKILKEEPDFLYNLLSSNDYDNKFQIEKKFNKIIKSYETDFFICPKCKGEKRRTVDEGFGAFGESSWSWIVCEFCEGEGKLSSKQLKRKTKEEKKRVKIEINKLESVLKH